MTAWLCCRRRDMGQALHHPSRQDSDARDGSGNAPLTMAEVIRERKKKAGMAGLSTLRRRLAQVARRHHSGDDWSHARYIRSVVLSWKTSEVCALHRDLEAGALLRDLCIQADLARAPAPTLCTALAAARRHRWCTDIELECEGVVVAAHRALLCARSHYFRALLHDLRNESRVKLEGLPTPLSPQQLNAVLTAIYQGTSGPAECICERRDSDLDIISADRSVGCGGSKCSWASVPLSALGVSTAQPQHDCRYLLYSGEHTDCRLVFPSEAEVGRQNAHNSPHRAHKLVLAASSRMFRSVLTRGASDICVDESVLPQRFAAALLHATYTDQVDLNLIGRNSSSPNNTGTKNSSSKSLSQLEDAFQLYEIGRFLEIPIVSQGCEDVIVSRLDPSTLPSVLKWVTNPCSSAYVRRQAFRYLLDEFPRIMQHPASAQLSAATLAEALRSGHLQAAEGTVLRALLRWGDAATHNLHHLPALVPLVRTEHVAPDCTLLQQAIRRGLVQTPPRHMLEAEGSAAAWLGRGPHRPCRIFIPYLEEIKALLESQDIPATEMSRARRSRYLNNIPDTLYMVKAGVGVSSVSGEPGVWGVGGAGDVGEGAARASWSCVAPADVTLLRHRARQLYAPDTHSPAHTLQICLRAVRERGLPDLCARALCDEILADKRNEDTWQQNIDDSDDECRMSEDNARSSSVSSLRANSAADSRSLSCRRDTPDSQRERGRAVAGASAGGGAGSRARLSSVVPDVAMGPNANTHLLTVRDYHHNFGATVLQLDLGDGATHAPPPGSRAQRAARQNRHDMMLRPSSAGNGDVRNAMEMSALRVFPHAASPRPLPPIANSPRCSHDNFTNLIQDRNMQIFDRNNCFNALNCRTNEPHRSNDLTQMSTDPAHRNNELSHDHRNNELQLSQRNNEMAYLHNDVCHNNEARRNNDIIPNSNEVKHLKHRNSEIDLNCHTLERRHLPLRNEGAVPNLNLRCNDNRSNHLSVLRHRNLNTPEVNERNLLTERNLQLSHSPNTLTHENNVYLTERIVRHKNHDFNEKSNYLSDRNIHQRSYRSSPTDRCDINYLSDRNIHRTSPDRGLNLTEVNLQLPTFNNESKFDRKCYTLDRHSSLHERRVLSQRNSDGNVKNVKNIEGSLTLSDFNSYLTLRNGCERRCVKERPHLVAVHGRSHTGTAQVSRESLRRTPSPRHIKREYFRAPPDYRHDPSFGDNSRGHSPNNYA